MTDTLSQRLSSLRQIIDDYDYFILDQWGVLHDGVAPYAHALPALALLEEHGKPFVILSNSGKRSAPNQARLVRLGFPESISRHILTSGELAWRALSETVDSPLAAIADKSCFIIAQPGENGLIQETPWREAPVDQAGMILVAGLTAEAKFEDYSEALAVGLERDLPMACANLDFDALFGTKTAFGPGRLAHWYAEQGGTVHRFGKPEPSAFSGAQAMLGVMPDMRGIMVGDSLYHDIAGAMRAGIDTLFVTSGIHGTTLAEGDFERNLKALSDKIGAMPTYTIHQFGV